ncbi:MAG: hypothetical protein ACEY3K_03445, partial [Wolbachia sp.]
FFSRLNACLIVNFVSNCQFFLFDLCNKARWNPVFHFIKFSISSSLLINFSGCQCLGTGMTLWNLGSSVNYSNDT